MEELGGAEELAFDGEEKEEEGQSTAECVRKKARRGQEHFLLS